MTINMFNIEGYLKKLYLMTEGIAGHELAKRALSHVDMLKEEHAQNSKAPFHFTQGLFMFLVDVLLPEVFPRRMLNEVDSKDYVAYNVKLTSTVPGQDLNAMKLLYSSALQRVSAGGGNIEDYLGRKVTVIKMNDLVNVIIFV
jgi:hypothetical protein